MQHFGKRLTALLLSCILLLSLLPTAAFAAEEGKIALMAVTADGFLIEPEYISYTTGNTVKDVLKASGHTFSGIDGGFISAIDGRSDNFSLHYDGDGYALDASAEKLTAIWFTANANQSYGENLRALAVRMADYNTATNGVKSYAAAQEAYAAAVAGFYAANDAAAATLHTALDNAMKKYEAFLHGEKVTLTLDVAQGDAKVTPAVAVFTSEFGPTTTVNDTNTVQLIPGSYSFDLSDGEFRHVRGTVTVSADTTLTATLPTGQWIKEVRLGYDNNWTLGTDEECARLDMSAKEGTYLVPDFSYGTLYPYFVPSDSVSASNVRVYKQGDPNGNLARSWESRATSLTNCIEADSLQNGDVVCEARLKGDGYEQYQTYTIHVIRAPSLSNLTAADITSGLSLRKDAGTEYVFDKEVKVYTTATTQEKISVTPTALCSATIITVAGKAARSGEATEVTLADCEMDGNFYLIPVVLTANGHSITYTIKVQKRPAIPVILTHEDGLDVKVYSQTGDLVAPTASTGTQDTYTLMLGGAYSYIATKDVYYHAKHSFPAQPGMKLEVPTPVTETWLTGLAAKSTNSAKAIPYPISQPFQPDVHEYSFTVESNSSSFFLQCARKDKNYTATVYYTGHSNTRFGGKAYDKALSSNDTAFTSLTQFMAVGGYGNSLRMEVAQNTTVSGATLYQDYYIHTVRSMTLNSMTAKDANENAVPLVQKQDTSKTTFDKMVFDYTASVGRSTSALNLTLKPLSSYQSDADVTVTVACGDWSQTLTYDAENKPTVNRTVSVPLNTASTQTETVTVTVSHTDPDSIAQTYTVEVVKAPPVDTTILTDPADATVFLVADATAARILPNEQGTYTLDSGAAYTLFVTRSGYVGKKLSVIAGEKTISVTLDKAPANTLADLLQPGDWPQFRADDNNNGVVNVRTPVTAEDTVLVWANKIGEGYGSGATGCPIIVGGYLYTYAGTSIVKVNKDTGVVEASGSMVASSSFAINSPTYADGMIFVGLSNGRVQAFDADTLKSLWVYKDSLGGQPNCPIAYCDGYIYTGFWLSETKRANFVCLSVTDEDPTQTTEEKLPTWTYTHNGFYWAGAYATEDFVIVTTDDGEDNYHTGYGSVLSLDSKTGELLDSVKATNVGDLRSSVCYDEETDAYYFTSKGGDLYKICANSDGTFVEGSLDRLHLQNGVDDNEAMSTSTPVIYQGRAYLGVSGASQFGAYSGHNITVVDLATFTIAYSVPTKGYPQTSGLLTSAYEDDEGYVYVYFFDNYTPGKLRVIRDRAGMTEVDHTYTTMETYNDSGEERTLETAYVLFTPSGSQAQYAICSPIVDGEGNIYFKNDSAQLMRLSSRMTELEITQQPDRTFYEAGDTFDATGMKVTAHFANGTSKDVTDYVTYTQDKLTTDDTEITVAIDLTKLVEFEESKWTFYQDKDGETGVEWAIPTGTVTIRIADGHSYGEPVWTWNDDFTASAAFTCANDASHKQVLPATVTSKVTTPATCEADGLRTYTATVSFEGKDYTDVKTETLPATGHKLVAVPEVPATCELPGTAAHWKCETCGKLFADANGTKETSKEALTLPATGHSYGEPVWTWNDDFTASAAFTCTKDASHKQVLPAAVTSKVTAPATCEATGLRTYTATVTFEGKNYTDVKTETLPVTGHSYGEPVWTWNDDFTASVTFTCTKDASHKQVLPATVTSKVTTPATCEADGLRTYTATVTFEGKNYTDVKTETLPATGHQAELRNAKDATCTEQGYTGDSVCKTCGTVLEAGTQTDALGHNFKNGKCDRCGTAAPVAPAQPATGDSVNPILLWSLLASAAAAAALLLLLLCKKQRGKQ